MSKSHYIIPIFVPHEGCPHDCVFCNQNSITGMVDNVDGKYTRRTIEEYLTTINRNNSIVEVSFFGGTFTAINIDKQKELLAVAKEFKDRQLIDYIHLSTRPDYIDHKILKNLKDYSVDIIELGIQSMDDEVLTMSCRGHSSMDVKNASKLIKEYGFILGHQIMLGLPGDTFDKDIKTAFEVVSMKPEICRIYPALLIKHTEMENLFYKGEYTPYSLDKAVEITKTVYGILVSHGIKVIRVGLQPTEEINIGREIVSGPFHPAFRELVEGSILIDMIFQSLKENSSGLTIYINEKDISKLYADKKKYFIPLKNKIGNIKVVFDNSLDRGTIVIKTTSQYTKLSVFDYICEKYYN